MKGAYAVKLSAEVLRGEKEQHTFPKIEDAQDLDADVDYGSGPKLQGP
jgi:hypothetical protein